MPTDTKKLKVGEVVNINIPFTYTIGEEGYYSNKVLETIKDCRNEVLAEIAAGVLVDGVVFLVVE